jgi:catechol 2,3-dioxygenase-like lactoylglutathione lyase family enzyme
MSRVQLALRVADLEASVDFHSKLFGATPAKRRPGYADFAIAEPPHGPGSEPREVYVVKADADILAKEPGSVCWPPAGDSGSKNVPACC